MVRLGFAEGPAPTVRPVARRHSPLGLLRNWALITGLIVYLSGLFLFSYAIANSSIPQLEPRSIFVPMAIGIGLLAVSASAAAALALSQKSLDAGPR